MSKYVTNDGLEFEAATPLMIIARLRGASLHRGTTRKRWMAEAAERIFQQTGRFVSLKSDEEFVGDLLKIGFIKEKAE
jgi:hypothetical protein